MQVSDIQQINDVNIKDIFKGLVDNLKDTLDVQYDNSRIDSAGYALILSEAIKNAQSLAVNVYLEKPLRDQQIAESVARVLNDNSKTTATINLTNRQKTALDDARNVKKAELLGNTISLIESGGNIAPSITWTLFNDAVKAINAVEANDVVED